MKRQILPARSTSSNARASRARDRQPNDTACSACGNPLSTLVSGYLGQQPGLRSFDPAMSAAKIVLRSLQKTAQAASASGAASSHSTRIASTSSPPSSGLTSSSRPAPSAVTAQPLSRPRPRQAGRVERHLDLFRVDHAISSNWMTIALPNSGRASIGNSSRCARPQAQASRLRASFSASCLSRQDRSACSALGNLDQRHARYIRADRSRGAPGSDGKRFLGSRSASVWN